MKKDLRNLVLIMLVILFFSIALPLFLTTYVTWIAQLGAKYFHVEFVNIIPSIPDIIIVMGSILSGTISSLVALLTIFFTIKYYNKKDDEQYNRVCYDREIEKINAIISKIQKREIILFDESNKTDLSRKILHKIIEYNSLLGRMESFYIFYAVDLLTKFLANRAGDEHIAGGLEIFSLDKTVRECAEKIAKYALYENANELLHSDPTTAYIIRAEAGSSYCLWASNIHDKQYMFAHDEESYDSLQRLFTLIEELLDDLENCKNIQYKKIMKNGDTAHSAYIIKKYPKSHGVLSDEEIKVVSREIKQGPPTNFEVAAAPRLCDGFVLGSGPPGGHDAGWAL